MAIVVRTSKTPVDFRIYRNSSLSALTPLVRLSGNISEYTNTVSSDDGQKRNWRLMIARGINALTPMTGSRATVTWDEMNHAAAKGDLLNNPSPGLVTHQYYVIAGTFWGVSEPSAYSDQSSLDMANREALTRFTKLLSAAQTQFHGLVAAGELGETLRGILRPAQGFRRLLGEYIGTSKKRARAFRRLPKKEKLKKVNRMLAETWLEYSFGWKPLIGDIDDAVHALADIIYYQPHRIPISARGMMKSSSVPTGAVVENFGAITVRRRPYIDDQIAQVRYYGSMQVLDDYGDPSWLRQFGFSKAEFIPSVWELIPYSFLIDYFTNIGDIISGFSVGRAGLKWINKGVKTTVRRYRVGVELDPLPPNTSTVRYSIVSSDLGSKGHFEKSSISRDSYSGSLIPSFAFRIPGMSTKWINMSALVASSRRAEFSIRG